MHHAWILRGVFRACIFDDGKCVHVKAQEQGGSRFCAFEQANHACFANAFGHFDAERFKFLCHNTARADFVESEFGVHMKITAQGLGVGEEFGCCFEKISHNKSLI